MRLDTKNLIRQLTATIAWLVLSVVALTFWMGISMHARAQVLHAQVSKNIAQNSRGPAAFPTEYATRAAPVPGLVGSAACSDYKRQIEQLQNIIALQNQKIASLGKK
jgi:hypothetical protein